MFSFTFIIFQTDLVVTTALNHLHTPILFAANSTTNQKILNIQACHSDPRDRTRVGRHASKSICQRN